MMQTDVKSKTLSATGALGNGARTRLKGVYFSATTGGTVTVTDGSAGGTTLLTFVVPVGANYFLVPGEGILSQGDPYITLTTAVGSFTFFYG